MDHRARDCTCSACAALGRVAAVVVDEETTEAHRAYIAKVLERCYAKILEKGLELLRQERRAEGGREAPGHREPPGDPAEPPAGSTEEVKEEKTEVEEEAPKKRKRRKRRPKDEEEKATEEEEKPAVEEKGTEGEVAADSLGTSETPALAAEGVKEPGEKDPRAPLPRSPKPSTNPAISLKEKKTKSEGAAGSQEEPRLRLRPKAKGRPRTSRSRSRARDQKDKKKRRSPSPREDTAGGDRGVSSFTGAEAGEGEAEEGGPPGDWEERPELPRRPKSPDHPPPLPGYKREDNGGFEEGLSREGLSGRASPGIWDSGASRHGAPGGTPAPGGRELGNEQGSTIFDKVGEAGTARPEEFHEMDEGFFQQRPQPGATGLLRGDAGTGAGSDKLHPSKPHATAEVFRRALGTMMCDDKMRSNMGMATMAQGDLLPLPVPQDDLQLAASVASLNHLGHWNNPPPGSVTSDLQQSALKNLSELVHRHRMWTIGEHAICFDDFFKRKSVDYLGDEVKVAMTVNWRAVCDSSTQEVGCLELERFCRLGTLEYVTQFEDYLLPPEDWKYVKPPRVMVEKDGWPELCQGLVARNVCDIMPIEELCHVEGKPLLNGMFSVGKREFKNGLETQRLIMNLIPVNTLCRPLAGDIGTLPGIVGLSGFLLDAGEVVLLSSEDIRCFFYLFGVPAKWRKYLGFNKLVPPELVPRHLAGKDCVLVAKVLPMGFLNSVSIAQHVHRNVVKWAEMAGVGGEREMRKDRPLSSGSALYRVYLDNF